MKRAASIFGKSGVIALVISLLAVVPALAHVVVRPGEVLTGTYATFSVSVPNEREHDTVEVRLEIPEGLTSVTPTVKPGWQITTDTADTPSDDGESSGSSHSHSPAVTAITWTGGSIPQGQRDDFTFSAKTPSEDGELVWKAYQTYADGTVVSWDKSEEDQPKNEDGSPDFSTDGPFSVTRVAGNSDTASSSAQPASAGDDAAVKAKRAFYVSIAAVIVAFIALILATRPKK